MTFWGRELSDADNCLVAQAVEAVRRAGRMLRTDEIVTEREDRRRLNRLAVAHVDPATNSVVAIIATGGQVFHGDVAVGGGYVWARISESLFAQIDPATDTVVARYGPPSEGSGGIDADDQAVWVSDYLGHTLWRLPTD